MDKFDLYFATLGGWVLHPGWNREGCHPPTLEYIADMAGEMVVISDDRADLEAAIQEENS